MCACCKSERKETEKKETSAATFPQLLNSVHQAGWVGRGSTASLVHADHHSSLRCPDLPLDAPIAERPQVWQTGLELGRPRGSVGPAGFTHTCLASCLPRGTCGLVCCRTYGGDSIICTRTSQVQL
jgi:hypothetical protein